MDGMQAAREAAGPRCLSDTERFALFGLTGVVAEVGFTALSDLAAGRGDVRLEGYTYLWMPPIWGAGGVLCERLGRGMRARGWGVVRRALAYAATCLAVEYVTGALVRRLTGKVPWDYRGARFGVHDLIRLDYAPFWALAGLAGEHLCELLGRIHLAPSVPASPSPQRGEGRGEGGTSTRLPHALPAP